LKKLCEDTFYAKLKKNSSEWHKYELNYDPDGYMEPKNYAPGGADLGQIYQSFNNHNYLVDFMFVQGIDMDRSKNQSNQDYIHSETANNKGISSFIHKYYMGMQHFYFLRDH